MALFVNGLRSLLLFTACDGMANDDAYLPSNLKFFGSPFHLELLHNLQSRTSNHQMSVCVVCDEPLVLNIADSDDDSDVEISGSSATARANQVPDDVHLHCGCHYHWSEIPIIS